MVKCKQCLQNQYGFFRKKLLFRVIIPSIVCIVIYFPIKKVIYYSAEPTRKKECHLIYPFNATNQAKTTFISVNSSSKHKTLIPFSQKGGTVNDISCLNETPVYGIVKVTKVEDIQNTMLFAREN